MEIKQSEFIISAVKKEQYPKDDKVEIAFVGRSNVGKSTLINTLTNRRKLVKVSNTPGKTRCINFFLINNEFYFVDLPGYGYAKISRDEKKKWGKIMEDYLLYKIHKKKIILLVDCRRKPTEDDVMMYNFIKHYGYEAQVVATKKDKLTKNELIKSKSYIRETLNMPENEKLIYFSSLSKMGKEEILSEIEEILKIESNEI